MPAWGRSRAERALAASWAPWPAQGTAPASLPFSPAQGVAASSSRAWAAQSSAGRAKCVHPECQPGCDSADLSQGVLTVTLPPAELGAGASTTWNSRIRPRVTPHWCFVCSFAVQICHHSWHVDRAQTPVTMFRCQAEASLSPLSPGS